MSSWTNFLDISGRVTEKEPVRNQITVGGIAVQDAEINKVRSKIVGDCPKWRNTDFKTATSIFQAIATSKIPCSVYQNLRTSEQAKKLWVNFWKDGKSYQRYLSGKTRQSVGFVRAANVLKYRLLDSCEINLFVTIVKNRLGTTILGADGRKIIKLRFVLDTDLQGKGTQDQYENNLRIWEDTTKLKKILNITPLIDSINFTTEQQEPLLLLPDYIAGCFHWDKLSPTNKNLTEEEIIHLRKLCVDEFGGYFTFKKKEFNIEYPLTPEDHQND